MRAAGLVVSALVVSGFAVLSVAGCGASQPASPSAAPSPGPTATPSPSQTPDDQLSIVVRDASGASSTWRLSCTPPAGTHPDPEKACQVLEQHGATALPPVPGDRQCSQVYGGPETATITGSWQGKPLTSKLSRTNGCESSRWQALEGLLPKGS